MPQQLRLLIVAILVASLCIAISNQVPGPELSVDDAFATVALQKKLSDDDDHAPGPPDNAFDDVQASVTLHLTALRCAFGTVRYVAASLPILYLSAGPRAPPLAA